MSLTQTITMAGGMVFGGTSPRSSHITMAGGLVFGGSASVYYNGLALIDLGNNPSVTDLFNAALASLGTVDIQSSLNTVPTDTTSTTGSAPSPSAPTVQSAASATAAPLTPSLLTMPDIALVAGTDVSGSYVLPARPDTTLPTFTAVEPTLTGGDLPVAPGIIIPDVPTFAALTIPDPPSLTLPEFAGVLSTGTLDLPTFAVDYSEPLFTSSALDAVNAKLATDIAGGIGVSASVEDAIWQREADRNTGIAATVSSTVIEYLSMMPADVLASLGAAVEAHAANAQLTSGRQQVVTHAELEQKNRAAARKATIALEDRLMTYASQIADRTLRQSMLLADAAQYAYMAAATKFKAEIGAYRAEAAANAQLIQAELVKVETFRAQVQAAQATNTLNRAQLASYNAQVQAVEQIIAIYETQIKGATIFAEIQAMQIEVYKLQVEAFKAMVQVVVAAARLREMEIKGETAKVEIYKAQVEEYRQRVRQVAELIEARTLALKTAVEEFKTIEAEYATQVKGRQYDVAALDLQATAQNEFNKSVQDVNSALVNEAAHMNRTALGALENEMMIARNQEEAFAQRERDIMRMISAEGQINVQAVRSMFSTLTETLAVQYTKFTTSHQNEWRQTTEQLDMASRFSIMSYCEAYGIKPSDSGLPGQIAGY